MYYLIVPSHVYANSEISSTDKLVYGLLNSMSYKSGVCYATNKQLAEVLELSERSITQSISKLQSQELIKVDYKNNNFRYIYTRDTKIGLEYFLTRDEGKISSQDKKGVKTKKLKSNTPDWVMDYLKELSARDV